MGLLVGSSVLTVCELLDLFIYNCFIKMVDSRHKFRSVGDTEKCGNPNNQEKSKEFVEAQEYVKVDQAFNNPIDEIILNSTLKTDYGTNVYNPYPEQMKA